MQLQPIIDGLQELAVLIKSQQRALNEIFLAIQKGAKADNEAKPKKVKNND